tara:strand:- start:5240 stop:8299 length:3060 start_codon:yes stop_codon:yes gene_type:complete
MPIPTKQHMTLVSGVLSGSTTIYTSGLINIGDTIQISGAEDNDGVYTVEEIVNTLNTGENVGSIFQDATCDTNHTSGLSDGSSTSVRHITHNANSRISLGLGVSGTGIPANSYITAINTSTCFTINADTTATNTNTTLDFADKDIYYVLKGKAISTDSSGGDPTIKVIGDGASGDKLVALGNDNTGNIDIWSNNAASSYGTKDNGWTASLINPTLTTTGNDAKYIFHFVDGALRVCNINETNTSNVKWFGFIQRQQFGLASGLTFAEWQEHPNNLAPPRNYGGVSYAYAHSNHDANTTFDDTTCDYNNSTTVTHNANSNIVKGLVVSQADGDVPTGAYIKSITSSTEFELSEATVNGSHTNSTLTFSGKNYFGNDRGVAVQQYHGSTSLRVGTDLAPNTADVEIILEDASNNNYSGVAKAGDVYSIQSSATAGNLGEFPKEFLFCKRESKQADSDTKGAVASAKFARAYGGTFATAPFDYAENDTPIYKRGFGWNVGLSVGTGSGDWGEVGGKSYELYQTFVYEGNQESLPVLMNDNGASGATRFTLDDVSSGSALRVSVFADLAYNGRISGGRIYIREAHSDEDLVLLADIDIVKGVRTSLDGDHNNWVYTTGYGYSVVSDAAGNSTNMNLDTYQTINGFSPDIKFLGIGGRQEGYKASVVANRRTWIANVKTKSENGEVRRKGDRIMYSEINKFDTFLENNFIDVSSGDHGNYVAIESFADRILAFKQNLLHIINVASPSPMNWYLEETVKYLGTNHPFSVAKTKNGIAWLSDDGCYLYNGNNVRNLIDKKISVSDSAFTHLPVNWNDWYRGSSLVKDAMLGYDPISNSLIMMRSPNHATNHTNRAFVYDFDSNGWVYDDSNLFTEGSTYTNFITDWNNNLTIGKYDGSSDVEFKKFLPVPLSKGGQVFVTRDIDFGEPALIKKIYKVIITYKSDGAETTPFSYAINGTQNFSGSGGGAFVGNFADTSGEFDVVTLTPSATLSCQSLQIRFIAPSAGVFEINDMTIEYRTIRNKKVT